MGFLGLLSSLTMPSEAGAASRAADTLPPFLAMNMAKMVATEMEQVAESQKVSEREEYLTFKGMRGEAERQRKEATRGPRNLENESAACARTAVRGLVLMWRVLNRRPDEPRHLQGG
jgi:hypothetical protein